MPNDENDDVPLVEKNESYHDDFADVLYGQVKEYGEDINTDPLRDVTRMDMAYYHQLASHERAKAFRNMAHQLTLFIKEKVFVKVKQDYMSSPSLLELKVKGRRIFAI
ncbi:MAG: hypothetical protein ACRBCI_10985 [Cellvibrionaceae bacterium]